MSSKGRKIFGQVFGIFDKPSSMKHPGHLIHLGDMEETDALGVTLHKEAQFGSRKSLKKVVKTAICIDYPNDCGQTPLFCACARDNEPAALLLLEYGANPNEKSQEGLTPCHVTCCVGNIRLLGKLIEAGGDMRLHDNDGNGMKEWAALNPDHRKRARMLEFLDRTYIYAMAYTGDSVNLDKLSKYVHRPYKQTSLMEIMKMRTGSDSSFESLKRVQSMGFGKVYLGNDRHGGIISVVPLISEASLFVSDEVKFDTGYGTFMEEMEWINVPVSLKQVKPELNVEDGIDLLIAEAEYLGRLRHPNILLLMGICQSTQLDKMMLVFERVQNATLHNLLHDAMSSLGFDNKMSIVNDVCAALDFIHSQNLMHCGLSSFAVYLVSGHLTKVGNFEFMVESIKADLGKPSQVSLVGHGEFLYNWMAPELIKGQVPHFSSDVYSFCCIVWEIFAGQVPWANLQPAEIKQKVANEGESLNLGQSYLPANLKAIVGYGLELREEDRLNKFSLISKWLKNDQRPKFQRIHTSLQAVHSKNHSSNCPPDWLSSSTSSPSLHKTHTEKEGSVVSESGPWSEGKNDVSFSRKLPHAKTTESTSDSNASLSDEGGDKNVSNASLYGSSGSSEGHSVLKPVGRFHLSSTVLTDMARIATRSLKKKKTPSEGDLQQSQEYLLHNLPMKPASHINHFSPRVLPQPRRRSDVFALYGRNNNGKPFLPDKSSTLPKDRSSQSKNEKQHCIDVLDLPEESYHVKKLARNFQEHLNQHKLRQAILKGSMAPRGSCPDLDTSLTEGGGKCVQGSIDCSDNKSAHDMDRMSVSDTGSLSCTPLLQKCSTPKHTPATAAIARQGVVSQSKQHRCHQMLYTTKILRETGTNWNEEGGGGEDPTRNSIRPWQVDDDDDDKVLGEQNKIPQENTESTNKEDSRKDRKELLAYKSQSDRHKLFLKEIRQAHSRMFKRSLGATSSEVSPGFYYHSPTIEVNSPGRRNTNHEFSPLVQLPANVDETTQSHVTKRNPGITATSSPNSKSQSNSPVKSIVKMLNQEPAAIAETSMKDDDSFWAISLETDKKSDRASPRQTEIETQADQYYYKSVQNEGVILKEGNCLKLTSTEAGKKVEGTEVKDQESVLLVNNGNLTKMSEEKTEPVSAPDVTSRHSVYSDDEEDIRIDVAIEDKETVEEILDGTFIVACDGQNDELDTSPPEDSSLSQHCLSVDSLKIGQWVDLELERIGEKMSHVLCKTDKMLAIDVASDASRIVLNGTSLSLIPERSATIGDKDGHSSVLNSDPVHTDGGNKTSDKSGGTDELLKIESAKSVSEVDGCDFEFQEFYIDDDFDSTEHIQPGDTAPKVPLCDCNVSTRHMTDNATNALKLESGSVKEKAAFFTSRLTNVKPPVFPRWPRKVEASKIVTRENVSYSALTTDSTEEEPRKIVVRESVSDKVTSKRESGGSHFWKSTPSFMRGVQVSRGREGVPNRAKPNVQVSSLRCGQSDPSVSVGRLTGEMESKRGNHMDEDDTLLQTIADATIDLDGDEDTLVSTDDISKKNEGSSKSQEKSKSSSSLSEFVRGTKKFDNRRPTNVTDRKSQTAFVNRMSQTSHLKNLKRTGGLYDSDSDSLESDQWIKSRLRAIQAKIKRRKARENYEASSEDETASKDDQIYSDDGNRMECTASLDKENTDIADLGDEKEYEQDSIHHEFLTSKSDMSASNKKAADNVLDKDWRSGKGKPSLVGTEMFGMKEKNTTGKHERSYITASHNSKKYGISSHTQEQSNEESENCIIAKKRPDWSGIAPKVEYTKAKELQQKFGNMTGGSREQFPFRKLKAYSEFSSKKISSKQYTTVSTEDMGQADKISTERKSSTNLLKGKKSVEEIQIEKDQNKRIKELKHPSILRKPSSSPTLRSGSKGSSSGTMYHKGPSPLPRSKFSASDMSKSVDRLISFQDNVGSDSNRTVDKPYKSSSGHGILSEDGIPYMDESFTSLNEDLDRRIVKTWLDKQDFVAENECTKQEDRQSISSKVMEIQSRIARLKEASQTASKHSKSAYNEAKEQLCSSLDNTSFHAKQGESFQCEKSLAHHSGSLRRMQENDYSLNIHSEKISAQKETRGSVPSWINHKDVVDYRGEQGMSQSYRPSSKDSGTEQVLDGMSDEHCLTLNLNTPTSNCSAEAISAHNIQKRKPCLGLHRFYIPRETWPDGCKARLNVQVSPTHPSSQRVTTTAIDPASGRTETLLDEMISTEKLRSTIQID